MGNKAHILWISVVIHYRKEVEIVKPVVKRTGHLAWTWYSGKFGFLLSEACITQSTQTELGDAMPLKGNSPLETSRETACSSPCPRTEPQTLCRGWGLVHLEPWQGAGGSCNPSCLHFPSSLPFFLMTRELKLSYLQPAVAPSSYLHSGAHFQQEPGSQE